MMNGKRSAILSVLVIGQIIVGMPVFGQVDMELSINARECYTGESLTLQALVSGTDQVEVGRLPELDWGTISYLGGQRRNSQSITSINGKYTRIEEKGFLMNFQITPGRIGEFTVPELTFTADGEVLRSTSFTIKSKAPEKSEDYAMELSTEMLKVYPGQEFVLDVKWFYMAGARSLSFSLPFLDEFEYMGQVPRRGRMYELILNNLTIQASGDEDFSEAFGETASCLSFSLILKAGTPGSFDLSESTSRFEGVTGTETVRDFFGNKQVQEKYSTLVIEGSGKILKVLPIPEPPAGMKITRGSEILGPVSIQAAISKSDISVGEPVTLSLTFSGAVNTDFSIPPLGDQEALVKNFSIPPERSPGKTERDDRIFIQTIRAKNDFPSEIPPITFPVFNTQTGKWEKVGSAAVPVNVLPTKVADSGDLEVWEDTGPVIREVEKNESGLMASYSGPGLLSVEKPGIYPWIPPIIYIISLIFPPIIWCTLFVYKKRLGRRRNGAAEFRKFLKSWKKNEFTLADYESAFSDYMEAETGISGKGIYGHHDYLEDSPSASETYEELRKRIDELLYARRDKVILTMDLRIELAETGERFFMEMQK